jgi:glycosyltransferase involved in cell wall biosynthesis
MSDDRSMTQDGCPLDRSLRLSAILPNFNHGGVIGEAIRALAEQIPAADEIIVVDDGSTDDSIEILERLCKTYATLRVIRLRTNQGAIAALITGFREARGKYIYFGAADDVTRPGLFAAMLAALDRYPQAAFACCEAMVIEAGTGHIGYRPPVRPAYRRAFFEPRKVAALLRRIDNWILPGAALVRRDVVAEAGGFDPTLQAFADGFLFRHLALKHGFCFVPWLGLTWRASAAGLSRAQASDPLGSMSTLSMAIARIRRDPVFPDWYPELLARRWRFGIGRLASNTRPMNLTVLRYVARGPIGRVLLTAAAAIGGPAGRIAAVGWLALQERPISLIGLVKTRLSRSRFVANTGSVFPAKTPDA